MFTLKPKKSVYLDYAAATPVRKEVLEAMQPYWSDTFANPSAIHKEGVEASHAVESARESIAKTLRIRTDGVIFTGSGTESNNLAIMGTLAQRKEEGIAYADMEIISTDIEHPSVTKTLEHASLLGVSIKKVPVSEEGLIDEQAFRELLSTKTVLVTFAYANSEVGVVQRVTKISRLVRAFESAHNCTIYVHIDAAQAPLWLPCALDGLAVDMLSLDAGKCYGPKGVGVLALRHGIRIKPHMYGGGQEGGLRPGTENVPLIVGAGKAIEIAQRDHVTRASAVAKIRDKACTLLQAIEGVVVNGSVSERLANNVNVSLGAVDSEFAVIVLDEKGIACSTKSACSGASGQGSSVVRALTHDEVRANATLRLSLGEATTLAEIEYTVAILEKHIAQTKEAQQKLTNK